ncbi:MAG: Coenzyme F420 hydrogenase/dehydrogenase, beta subunit C-terminal domain [Actinomycetota bacterium]|nr:Coenzyme F420 hydrogenase/dehydrogenase, beta subunit C-terminal domain [Actinomycetota bacterium]
MKRYQLREQMNGIAEPPGKVWFWELAAGVIDAGRCIQCGTCVAACPSNSIGINEGTGLPELVKMCTGCSLCWDFCPRGGLRYEALWPASTPQGHPAEAVAPATNADPADSSWKITGGPPGDGLGSVLERFAVKASTRPDGAQDGGAVTALLCALLDAGEIDGALVSKPSENGHEPWKGVATVATTPAEVLASAGSFYNQTMALAELDLSRYPSLPSRPRLAVVGTPCEVQGLSAMQARRWSTGAHRVDAVVLGIALLCTKSFDYESLVLRELRDRRKVDLKRVAKIDVVRGRLVVEYRDGQVALDEPVKDFHGAALKGCDECADFLGRSADLSVGAVGSIDGWSSVLVRTERGRQAFEVARSRLDVRELDDPDALARLDQLDKRIAVRSLERPFDPDAPLFIDYDEHLRSYERTTRQPVVIRR